MIQVYRSNKVFKLKGGGLSIDEKATRGVKQGVYKSVLEGPEKHKIQKRRRMTDKNNE